MGNKSRITQEQIDDICASYVAGLSQRVIAEQYGMSTMTVCRLLQKNNVEARYRQGGRPFAKVCKRGHELKDPNLYYLTLKSTGKTHRACKACCNLTSAEYYQRVTKHKTRVR